MLSINQQPVPTTLFPDNTSQVWKLPRSILSEAQVAIDWEFSHEGEFMVLAQLKTLLDQYDVSATLYITYLPYGRQDKEVSNDATFGLVTFANLINSLKFTTITILDPHSERVLELVDRSQAVYPRAELQALFDQGVDLVCYPDNGALKKYSAIYSYPYIYGEKVRDQSTGHILSYQLHGDPKGKHILIVDDICDGGMTFQLLAKDLKKAGAVSVRVFVTHGIFSKGTRSLFASGISEIATPNNKVGPRYLSARV